MTVAHLNNRPVRVGEVISPLVADIRLQRAVAALHGKGPRGTYELLREIIAHHGGADFILRRAQIFAAIDVADLDAAGARNFPPPPIHLVRR